MSEFGASSLERTAALAALVRYAENAHEEQRTQEALADHLFHHSFIENVIVNGTHSRFDLMQLEQDFLSDKQGKNMGERFDLALSDKYLGVIRVVELGKATDPAKDGAVDGLKSEYLQLLHWMKEDGMVGDELSRQESDRRITVREPALEDAKSQFVILDRVRPLIAETINHQGLQVDIHIAKRMVFAMPKDSLKAVLKRHESGLVVEEVPIEESSQSKKVLSLDDKAAEYIEDTFLPNGWGGIQPIRTAYYLETNVVGRDPEA